MPGLAEILLAPGQRVDVIVTAGLAAGASAMLQSLPYDRGMMGMGMMGGGVLDDPAPDAQLLECGCAAGRPADRTATHRATRDACGLQAPRPVVRDGDGMMGGGMMQFLIDGKSFDMSRVDLTSRVNEIEEWTVENRSSMDHPFHLHGTQFQVMRRTRGGATLAEPMLAWRDVVNVAAFETVTFRVVQSQLGKRMYHCHILEHEDQGMMGVLNVVA